MSESKRIRYQILSLFHKRSTTLSAPFRILNNTDDGVTLSIARDNNRQAL